MFLDTNVLVAAFSSRGICADLLRHVLLEHELIVGEVVLNELNRTLLKRIKVPARVARDVELLLRDHEVVAKPRRHLNLGLRDPDDEWIVASALSGKADALVTGDKDILEAPVALPVAAYTPRGFWDLARRG